MSDSPKSQSSSNSENIPLEIECPRAQSLYVLANRRFPGPLDSDVFPEQAIHYLIDLASELSRCHLSVKQAQEIYAKFQRRYDAGLQRYGSYPGSLSWIEDEEKRLQVISNYEVGAELFLRCLRHTESKIYRRDFYIPFPC